MKTICVIFIFLSIFTSLSVNGDTLTESEFESQLIETISNRDAHRMSELLANNPDAAVVSQKNFKRICEIGRHQNTETSRSICAIAEILEMAVNQFNSPLFDAMDRGYAHIQKGEWSKAVEALKEAVRIQPDNLGARQGLGQAYLGANKPSDAAEQFEYILSQPVGKSPLSPTEEQLERAQSGLKLALAEVDDERNEKIQNAGECKSSVLVGLFLTHTAARMVSDIFHKENGCGANKNCESESNKYALETVFDIFGTKNTNRLEEAYHEARKQGWRKLISDQGVSPASFVFVITKLIFRKNELPTSEEIAQSFALNDERSVAELLDDIASDSRKRKNTAYYGLAQKSGCLTSAEARQLLLGALDSLEEIKGASSFSMGERMQITRLYLPLLQTNKLAALRAVENIRTSNQSQDKMRLLDLFSSVLSETDSTDPEPTIELESPPQKIEYKDGIGVEVGKLTVLANPSDARIRIMNIEPKYSHEIELVQGEKYDISVTRKGYKSFRKLITITESNQVEWVSLTPIQ